ncbi:TrbC/VirB2 family protein [Salmonella enterica]|nr:TrbC/VirB2 family protein [Salmonella enterica]EBR1292746.1 TrbC/VirB2 family protein [Salmonella enterica]
MKIKNRPATINRKAQAAMAALAALLMTRPAAAQGLQKARSVLETVQAELTTIVPIAAAVILLCLGIAYAGRFIEKDTFVRWAIGVIIAGSAVQITAMLFT